MKSARQEFLTVRLTRTRFGATLLQKSYAANSCETTEG